ncbi:HAD family hydrolase [Chromobacterium sphagni]|uniref:phosphoglycolate phosphatase n=1 Tax=Chromobacterium sphagni TaxID=1903179 RepID=A0A1S1X461_9NEIS|nr:HAD family hydrolase [Chromobacterium sphagni]OHX14281.1 phosphoglycolate phosphatase [Chromobacterium sphagni]OHX16276.1 phosphoglycolate phosphatase [Chromobacterium sphagni]
MTTPPLPDLAGIEHLVFDWNGTLIDDIELAVAAVNRCCERFQVPPVTRERYRRDFGFPIADFYARLGFDFARNSFAEIVAVYLGHFDAHVGHCRLHAGASELLDWADARGIGASVLSASQRDVLLQTLESKRLLHRFEHVVGLDHSHANSKLEEARQLQQRLRRPAASTLFVGDTLHDWEVASQVGWRVLLLDTGHQDHTRLQSSGAAICTGLGQLHAALSATTASAMPAGAGDSP